MLLTVTKQISTILLLKWKIALSNGSAKLENKWTIKRQSVGLGTTGCERERNGKIKKKGKEK